MGHYLNEVDLKCIRNEADKIIGFLGVAEQNLEMLFIHPSYKEKQMDKILLNFSIEKINVKKVDVNEQNKQAIGFYKKHGFETKSRSESDSSEKPHPTLHMELRQP